MKYLLALHPIFAFMWLLICVLFLCYCFAFWRAVCKCEKNRFNYDNEFVPPFVPTYRKIKRIIQAVKTEWKERK